MVIPTSDFDKVTRPELKIDLGPLRWGSVSVSAMVRKARTQEPLQWCSEFLYTRCAATYSVQCFFLFAIASRFLVQLVVAEVICSLEPGLGLITSLMMPGHTQVEGT